MSDSPSSKKPQSLEPFHGLQWRAPSKWQVPGSPGSDAESRKSADRVVLLRREIAEQAAYFDHKANSQLGRPGLPHLGISPDFRGRFSEPQRSESLRKLNYDTIQFQLDEKRSRQQFLNQQRKIDRLALENQQKLLDLQKQMQRSQQLAQASDYRGALDLQRQVKKVAQRGEGGAGALPENVNLLGYEMPEFRNQVYTFNRPKVVPTDPITFLSPRYIAPVVRMNSDPRLFLEDSSKRSPPSGIADYGQMAVRPSIFRDPVCHRQAGLNYRDTRNLIQ